MSLVRPSNDVEMLGSDGRIHTQVGGEKSTMQPHRHRPGAGQCADYLLNRGLNVCVCL